MVKLSFNDYICLAGYIDIQRKKDLRLYQRYDNKNFLKRLKASGINIDTLDEIPFSPLFNPANIKFRVDYLAKRIEVAYALQEELQKRGHNRNIRSCYEGIDELITEMYEGNFGGEYIKAAAILDDIHLDIIKPNHENTISSVIKYANLHNAFLFSMVTGIGSYYSIFRATNSNFCAALALITGLVAGYVGGAYIDTHKINRYSYLKIILSQKKLHRKVLKKII